MNRFDDEKEIIHFIQKLDNKKLINIFSSIRARKFYKSLHNRKIFENWIDNSGKNQIPPDFYSDKYKYMLEVMQVDDYELGSNSPNALESKMYKEMINQIGINRFNDLKDNCTFLFVPNLNNSSKHGYDIYLNNFKRVVENHNNKVKDYKLNHPGYKLGFLIFDESTGYIVPHQDTNDLKHGDGVLCSAHYFWLDKRFLDILIKCDVDYIIWITPFKNIEQNREIFPYGSIIDVKKLKIYENKFLKYNTKKVCSIEI